MASSLEKLVDTTDKSSFKPKAQEFKQETDLILRKGVYPYWYTDSRERLYQFLIFAPLLTKNKNSSTTQWDIHSKLSDKTISRKDYDHAKQVWKSFNCKILGDAHDHYLKTDVVLLTDVFQTFRKTFMDAYNFDPLHFYTDLVCVGTLYSIKQR